MKDKKVCFTIIGLGIGGAEKLVLRLVNHYCKENSITLVVFSTDLRLKKELDKRVQLVSFNRSALGCFKFLLFCTKSKFDLIHSHMYFANFLSRVACIFSKKTKNVSSVHNTTEASSKFKKRLIAVLYRLTDFCAEKTTNVSVKATSNFIQSKSCSSRKVETLYNGLSFDDVVFQKVELDFFKENTINLCSIGSLTYQKGYDNAFKAIKELVICGYDIRYLIVGSGPLEQSLKDKVVALGIDENVFFYGTTNDVYSLLNMADMFILPSRWEGFGLVVLEAVYCNKPVLSTPCDGPIEILGTDYPLFFDDFAGLTQNIKKVSSGHFEIQYNRNFILNKFSFENMTSKLDSLYEKVLFEDNSEGCL